MYPVLEMALPAGELPCPQDVVKSAEVLNAGIGIHSRLLALHSRRESRLFAAIVRQFLIVLLRPTCAYSAHVQRIEKFHSVVPLISIWISLLYRIIRKMVMQSWGWLFTYCIVGMAVLY